MGKLNGVNVALTISSFVGLGLSIYSYFIEQQHESYKAFCDISEVISCSKTFKSKYGTGFGIIGDVFSEDFILNIPNSLLGIITYSILIILSQSSNRTVTMVHYITSILSVLLSVYLAYVMVVKISMICVVCLTTYVVNVLNLVLCRAKLRLIGTTQTNVKKVE